ncbi:uncharacterized protein EV420DRAFT_588368 [Desarmillaria tabescens]|uniref:Uncharacterized protein n=1 Tax=Armillaria tabescens TaxID=1929756 RepID=A0AA39K611_ARMTA|nr:uncharacterized protein EV420DRAFT_588368 [Desarmillaria tabescens]KAK0455211.1 hypothetical protein EV420DRAFT_588368 [Desarmillaria tabescens]
MYMSRCLASQMPISPSMSSLILEQQRSFVVVVVMASVVVISKSELRWQTTVPTHTCQSFLYITHETNHPEDETRTFCLPGIQFIRGQPTLPPPITTPPTRTAAQSITDAFNGVSQFFYGITLVNQFIAFFASDTHSDNHTRRGVYPDPDGPTHHGLGDRNSNTISTPDPVVCSDVNDGGTQGGRGEIREGI